MANLLEGLKFPATKSEIKEHVNRKSPSMGNRINDVFEAIQNNLDETTRYENVYEIEQAAGLVENKEK
jgi:DNA-binding MurR/RpiR family transcriptional regulator